MNSFIIEANSFLSRNIQAFYHTDYLRYKQPGNPDYINVLKNTYDSYPIHILNSAISELKTALVEDWDSLVWDLPTPLVVCVVPRAKAFYTPNQLLFKSTISSFIRQVNKEWSEGNNSVDTFIDGTGYIVRHTNTRTTHLPLDTPNYNNDGASPYPGITRETCNISKNVLGKNILLIDDIYTSGVNIDEDATQALLDQGAKNVVFYAIGKTKKGVIF